jgi:hypothetical protein
MEFERLWSEFKNKVRVWAQEVEEGNLDHIDSLVECAIMLHIDCDVPNSVAYITGQSIDVPAFVSLFEQRAEMMKTCFFWGRYFAMS